MDQPELEEEVGRISQPGQIPAEHTSGGVSDRELVDQSGIPHAAAVKVSNRLWMSPELVLVEIDSFSKGVIRRGAASGEDHTASTVQVYPS